MVAGIGPPTSCTPRQACYHVTTRSSVWYKWKINIWKCHAEWERSYFYVFLKYKFTSKILFGLLHIILCSTLYTRPMHSASQQWFTDFSQVYNLQTWKSLIYKVGIGVQNVFLHISDFYKKCHEKQEINFKWPKSNLYIPLPSLINLISGGVRSTNIGSEYDIPLRPAALVAIAVT